MAIQRQKIDYPGFRSERIFRNTEKIESNVINLIKKRLNLKTAELIITSSARDSIFYILRELKRIIKKKKVMIASFNFSLMSHIIRKSGLEPVYVDVDINTFNISENDLKEKIDPECGIAIITHILGNPVELSVIRMLQKRGIIVIEDCAHSFDAQFSYNKDNKNKFVKTGCCGDIAVFSFNYTKPLNSIYGAAIGINNSSLKRSILLNNSYKCIKRTSFLCEIKLYLKSLITYFLLSTPLFDMFTWQVNRFIFRTMEGFDIIDYFSRDNQVYMPKQIKKMNKISLLILENNIKKFDSKLKKISLIRKEYSTRLREEKIQKGSIKTGYLYALLVKDKNKSKKILIKFGIDIKTGYCRDISKSECNMSAFLEKHMIYLPFYQSLDLEKIEKITGIIKEINLAL
ncbi:DegT/DnrJ/EryC1/StrS aminotransferase family protein [Candidatus Woesearchaeota archaeon]|nr:DegT/DnrJ/EryC1/StrS aminotransferase family protein [Candidatus Woesearchaeota archaeon]